MFIIYKWAMMGHDPDLCWITRGYQRVQYMKVLWASSSSSWSWQVAVGLKNVENQSTTPKVPWSPGPFLTGRSGNTWKRQFKSWQYFQVQNGGNAISVYYVMHPKTKCYSNMIIIMIISMIILMIVETWHGLRINSITNQVSSDFFISPGPWLRDSYGDGSKTLVPFVHPKS